MKTTLLTHRFWATACAIALCALPVSANDIHVSPGGSDDNAGSEAAPLLTIHKAMELVQAGDRILVHEGTYYISERIKIPALETSPELRCELRAWPDDAVGKVIIDGSRMNHTTEMGFKMARCIYVNHLANYWTFYGLVLQNAEDNGMKVEGSYNIIERCTFRWNNDTGLQIGMFKDFSIEETKSFPISGTPQYNPDYTYCRYNTIINCDSYENYDSRNYKGIKSDNERGSDADGFACKLFPGPGTEFHGCRAWTNSDDNWDLYMVYHPVVIDHCWAWHAGYYRSETGSFEEGKNGNGFKLGGGGSAGGAAFDQSVGAHVVTNCVSFDNLHKGFDQNNAYEGMYILNCVAWGNEYNYRFPTEFKYGQMTIHNCVGWGATAQKSGHNIGNHEFLSPDKTGYKDPTDYTTFNSWIEIDGCSPIKESFKPSGQDYTPATMDHSAEFLSLSVNDFLGSREPDGSLPDNNFARLKPGSIFKDMGTPIIGFTPTRWMTQKEASDHGLELITADDIYIPFNDAAPDFGAYELDGVPYEYVIPEKIELVCATANASQEVVEGDPIDVIVYEWNDAGTDAVVEGLAEGLEYTVNGTTLTISGIPTASCDFTVTVSGNANEGVKPVTTAGSITLVKPFYVYTDGWYHFQDAEADMPADLKTIFEMIQGDKTATTIDPEKDETASGFGKGALCLGESNGGFKLLLDDGVFELKINLFTTGGRQFKITYTMADGTTSSVTTKKYSKGAYGSYDILEAAGLSSEDDLMNVRSIIFQQSDANGGARIYDMLVKVPVGNTTGITAADAKAAVSSRKMLIDSRIVIVKNGTRYNAIGQKLQ